MPESSAFLVAFRTGQRAWILPQGSWGGGTGALGPFCNRAALLYPAVLSLDSSEAGYPSGVLGTQICSNLLGCCKSTCSLPQRVYFLSVSFEGCSKRWLGSVVIQADEYTPLFYSQFGCLESGVCVNPFARDWPIDPTVHDLQGFEKK